MGKSFRKSPCCGITTAKSEKDDKQIYNRKFRRIVHQQLYDFCDDPIFDIKEVSNVWQMAKDGRQWFGNSNKHKKLWRK